MYRSEVSLVQPGKSTDRPAGDKVTRVELCKSRMQYLFFLAVGFIGLECSAMCPRRRISYARACMRLFVACVHLVNCSARCLTVSALLCVVPVRQTAPRELPSLQEQAVRAERQWQPQRTIQQLQCVQCKCYTYDFER